MDSFRQAIQEREAAWRLKAKEESRKTWQPALDEATEEFVAGLRALTVQHSDKLGIIGQALLKGSGDETFTADLVLDEMEVAAARATKHLEGFLQTSLTTLGSDRQLVTLSRSAVQTPDDFKEAVAPVDQGEAEHRRHNPSVLPTSTQLQGQPALFTPQAAFNSFNSWRLPDVQVVPSAPKAVETPTGLNRADAETASIREQNIASALREFGQGGGPLTTAARKSNAPFDTVWARLNKAKKSLSGSDGVGNPESEVVDAVVLAISKLFNASPRTPTAPKTSAKRHYGLAYQRDLRSALRDVRRGMSQNAAAEKWGVSKWTIKNHVKREKAPTTPKSESSKALEILKTRKTTKSPKEPRPTGAIPSYPVGGTVSFLQMSAVQHFQVASKHQRHKCHDYETLRVYSDYEIVTTRL
ncbi:hypothetical protein B0T14DRAFT_568575 [Immersiella caudata]|uniref:HTH psq-type domain-containing protein n=1 Tax=Immersiella caudata TaxID=314043 RepID=A0AA39WKD6_9PEZI|nr:hypothetical protein B0T14DRAFT_568575 [Immersiella caudata]